jgi:hypothetical protein
VIVHRNSPKTVIEQRSATDLQQIDGRCLSQIAAEAANGDFSCAGAANHGQALQKFPRNNPLDLR